MFICAILTKRLKYAIIKQTIKIVSRETILKGEKVMAKKYPNLFCVKSILTIILSVGFTVLCFLYPETYSDTMKTIIVSVITFYFSHQIQKQNENEKEVNKN